VLHIPQCDIQRIWKGIEAVIYKRLFGERILNWLFSLNTCCQEKGIARRNRNTTNSFRSRSNNLEIMIIQWRE